MTEINGETEDLLGKAEVCRPQARTPLREMLNISKLSGILTAPVIYSLIIPITLLDLFITVYQRVCFPVYGIPRVKRVRWAQMDCIVLDLPQTIAIDLWDGTRAYLPVVNDRALLSATLEKVAAARAIPVRGGAGLDEIPESAEDELEEA